MKLSISDDAAKKLVDQLGDQQPGTELAKLRDTVARTLESMGPKRKLSVLEFDLVLDACLDRKDSLRALGNPSDADRARIDLINSAMNKLEMLRDLTAARGDE